MKATKNMNGAARVAVQAKLDAADKELRKARDLVQQRTEELGRVRGTVRQYTVENLELELDIAEEQIQYHKERVATVKWIAYGLCGAVVVLAWKLSQHIGWFGGL